MTYVVERIASGDVTAYALLNTSSYLLSNWTIQTDQNNIEWSATLPEYGMRAPFVGGLELGSGMLYGNYSGVIEFFLLTELMQQYITTSIMNDKPIEIVTLYAYDDFSRELAVFTGELIAPYAANAEATYRPAGHRIFANNQYLFKGGTKKQISVIGSETTLELITDESGFLIGDETQS